MSLLSAIIIPHLEKQLIAETPEMAQAVTQTLHGLCTDLAAWAENKLTFNVDEKVGDENEK